MKNKRFFVMPVPPSTDIAGLCTVLGMLVKARGGETGALSEHDEAAMQRFINHPIEESKQKLTTSVMKFDRSIRDMSNTGKVTVVDAKTNDRTMTVVLDYEPELNFVEVNPKG